MWVASAEITLRLRGAISLKDKRRVAKSLVAKIPGRFGVSCAEVAQQDSHQVLVLGLATCGSNRLLLQQVLERVVGFIEQESGLECTNVHLETY